MSEYTDKIMKIFINGEIKNNDIWCGECGYKGKGIQGTNGIYCPYCLSTGNDVVKLIAGERRTEND